MKKYIYKNKITGKLIFSDFEIKDKDLKLINIFYKKPFVDYPNKQYA